MKSYHIHKVPDAAHNPGNDNTFQPKGKNEGQEAGNMIRCCTCAHWFYTDCIDLNRDEAVVCFT